MSKISVAHGWQHILDAAVDEAKALPEEWLFEIVKADRVEGALKIWATYAGGDVPLDDYLPPERKLPHPYRSFLRIRETARAKSLVTCECCGREGKLIDAGKDARVRCVRHECVVDVAEWSENPVGAMFASADKALAHFLEDYGSGVDMMKELARKDGDDDTRH